MELFLPQTTAGLVLMIVVGLLHLAALMLVGAMVAKRKANDPVLGAVMVALLGPLGFVLCFFLPKKPARAYVHKYDIHEDDEPDDVDFTHLGRK